MRSPTTPRLARHLARFAVRTARRQLRNVRRPRPPGYLDAGAGVRLVPVTARLAPAWFALTRHGRPPVDGLAASTLGGAARTRRQWLARARELRRHVRRGDQRGYLVEAGGAVVGEALAFLDDGTGMAELVIWLADVPAAHDAYEPVIAALADDLLGEAARQAMFSAPVGDRIASRTAARLGFTREGTVTDPPYADRDVFVRHLEPRTAAE